MRVVLDGRSLSGEVLRGWDRYTVGLVRALAASGVEVVLAERKRAPLNPAHVQDLPCGIVSLDDMGGLWWEQVALPRALSALKADIYHAPAEHGVPLAAPCATVLTLHSATAHSYADLLARGRLTGRLADYAGSDTHPDALTPSNLYWHAQVRRADWVLAPSAFAREEIVAFLRVPPQRVTVTPLAADPIFNAPPRDAAVRRETRARIGVTSPYLLYVGGYERHKNVEGLIAAFAHVRGARPGLVLLCVGSSAPPPRVAEAVRAAGLEPGRDVVLASGYLGPALVDLYDDAELLVTLSWRETFGLPALEAMTRGVAVVASSWGAAPEVVGDGGQLVDPRDHAAAATAMLELLEDKGRGERARAAAARFSWSETASRTMAVYERLMSAHS
jgi:glycosyltransferase involved in cell wall biosynthesis